MATPRYLCSHLVRLVAEGREQWVNLEEIWESGAVLECEEPVDNGLQVEILAGETSFEGHATEVEQHEFGWRLTMTFSPLTPWKIELWRPEHTLNAEELGQ